MKKIISLVLVIAITLSFISCGEKNTPLTLENIEDYIEINASVKPGYTTRCLFKDDWVNLYKTLDCALTVSGVPGYEFNDVVIEIRCYHIPPKHPDFESVQTIYIDLNLAGNGKGSCSLQTPVATEEWDNISSASYVFYSSSGISSMLDYTAYEIVGVTGTVKEK